MNKIAIVFHAADFDGLFSAMISALGEFACYEHCKDHSFQCFIDDFIKNKIIFFPYLYKKENDDRIREAIESSESFEKVVFVDCMSLDEDLIRSILTKKISIYTYDHHEISYNWQKEFLKNLDDDLKQHYFFNSINSSSSEDAFKISSTELCYVSYKGYLPVPSAISLISAYDVWNKERFDWDNDVLPYQYGLRTDPLLDVTDPLKTLKNNSEIVGTLFEALVTKSGSFIAELKNIIVEDYIEIGKNILEYISTRNKGIAKSHGKKVSVIVKSKERSDFYPNCYIVSDYMNNSKVFEDGVEDCETYDLLILAKPDIFKPETLPITIITSLSKTLIGSNVSAGEICKLLGGGGHKGIGGCIPKYELSEADSENGKNLIITFSID